MSHMPSEGVGSWLMDYRSYGNLFSDKIKWDFFQVVYTMHHLNTNEMHKEKAGCELHEYYVVF